MSVRIDKRFYRLGPRGIALLEASLDGRDVLVKGLQTKGVVGYRGGCGPYLGLAIAGTLATVVADLLPRVPLRGAALGIALASMFYFVRAFVYARLSKRLLSKPGGWLALGWTKERLVYRSFEECLLVDWADIERIELIGEDAPKTLRGTLWVHLAEKRRILIPAREDGLLAGRTMAEWYADMDAAKRRAG
jgi:hypothetical protein